jgi:hypothetical protein
VSSPRALIFTAVRLHYFSRDKEPQTQAALAVGTGLLLCAALERIKDLLQHRWIDGGPAISHFETELGLFAYHRYPHRRALIPVLDRVQDKISK